MRDLILQLSKSSIYSTKPQGTIGIENQLTADEIAMADIVLLAADVKVTGEERFAGKKVVKVATETAVKSPNKLIEKLSEIVNS
ncbi:PTS fructose transporter subunit IIB [Klebsiella pneumoniae]|uniref:PTS fructose transporter subunit IIB n=1 Tax=Klebsiella pneumoniae TaxID=573 RepID=UPI00217578A3|nr:PTS fructose transporter subunit IIB [Klebsiella pneumoniae]UWA62983.1 PTS fructose transporter subunit IIB [Klebsiella pneumoniae]